MANKPKQKEFKSSKGNTFTFQTIPHSKYLDIVDVATKVDGNPSLSKLYPLVLDHIVVQPGGLTVDDFETFVEMREVCEEALVFQQGE